MSVEIIQADIMDWCGNYKGPKAMALLCDPPYSLGFMNKAWDGDIAFRPETWAALAEHLLPGAFGMAFASSRGWHRLAVAIEDAGLRIHPSIFGWAFGSGFPKATRIDTQIDKAVGAERELIGYKETSGYPDGGTAVYKNRAKSEGSQVATGGMPPIYGPATDLAKAWEGYRYGLQAMKPALEPIIVFQKPYKGKPVDSIVETGAGALNIDGARIAGDVPQTVHGVSSRQGEVYGKYRDEPEPSIVHPQGRWPANFYVEHHPDCVYKGTKRVSGGNARKDKSGGCKFFLGGDKRSETPWGNSDGKETVADWDCVEECPVRRLGEQSGAERALHPAATGTGFPKSGMFSIGDQDPIKHNDKGTAARFFFNVNRQLDEADPVLYQAKATRKERDAGLGDFAETEGGIKNASGRGYSERDPYAKIKVRNPHPTVKPIDLTRWLATLLLPPTEYAPRRILIPFSGSGSEMIGAHLAGWEQIVGIEMAQEYCEIAEARLKYWTTQPKQLTLIGVNND